MAKSMTPTAREWLEKVSDHDIRGDGNPDGIPWAEATELLLLGLIETGLEHTGKAQRFALASTHWRVWRITSAGLAALDNG